MERSISVPLKTRRTVMDAQVEALLKDQINKELFSAYFYLAIAGFYQAEAWTASATGSSGRPTRSRRMP